ncbi:hypothetical protein ACFWUZ_28560 [Streptomyces sp. NPDC058646]|uniref:hypothetical protein n=1 Tax=Streptomyces sp. NPDC058646 TaxID=3346574 RepID=UPI00364E8E5A
MSGGRAGSTWNRRCAHLLDLARRHRRPAVALRLTTDLETCLERNAVRSPDRRVPDQVLRWQYALALEATTETLFAEGFTAVLSPTPTDAPASTEAVPDIRFVCVTWPDGQHA